MLSLRKKNCEIEFKEFNPRVMLLQPVESVESGLLVRKSEFKPFDIAEALSPFTSTDFSISSLAAVGALEKLKSTYMANTSSLNVADSFENLKIEPDVQSVS